MVTVEEIPKIKKKTERNRWDHKGEMGLYTVLVHKGTIFLYS